MLNKLSHSVEIGFHPSLNREPSTRKKLIEKKGREELMNQTKDSQKKQPDEKNNISNGQNINANMKYVAYALEYV